MITLTFAEWRYFLPFVSALSFPITPALSGFLLDTSAYFKLTTETLSSSLFCVNPMPSLSASCIINSFWVFVISSSGTLPTAISNVSSSLDVYNSTDFFRFERQSFSISLDLIDEHRAELSFVSDWRTGGNKTTSLIVLLRLNDLSRSKLRACRWI